MALIVFVLRVHDSTDGTGSVLIGTFDSSRLLNAAVLIGLCTLAAGLCVIPAPRWWLLLLIPLRLAAVGATIPAAALAGVSSSMTVVPIVSAGCETGYVVAERSFLLAGSGTVYRADGLYVTDVARTTGDDGYHPFFDGAYTVQERRGLLAVWYNIDRKDGQPPAPTGEPAFTLPAGNGDTSRECGIEEPAPHPLPAGRPPSVAPRE